MTFQTNHGTALSDGKEMLTEPPVICQHFSNYKNALQTAPGKEYLFIFKSLMVFIKNLLA